MKITAVHGDITEQHVDAIVNAANGQMRGGGGVDGAIHRIGGVSVLQDCIDRFPDGLETGEAGWTIAGNLPARWVIHAVGPNYAAGQQDRRLLESCYRNALTLADELGARTIAFPLVSAGIYGWPEDDAVHVAVETIARTPTQIDEVRIVAFSEGLFNRVEWELARETPMKILQAVQVLHDRGYHAVRVWPGMNASGTSWRIAILDASNVTFEHGYLRPVDDARTVNYTTAGKTNFGDGEVTVATTIDDVADLILRSLPELVRTETLIPHDADYVHWYAGLIEQCMSAEQLPIAYSDSYDPPPGWEIGWGSGATYPEPPSAA